MLDSNRIILGLARWPPHPGSGTPLTLMTGVDYSNLHVYYVWANRCWTQTGCLIDRTVNCTGCLGVDRCRPQTVRFTYNELQSFPVAMLEQHGPAFLSVWDLLVQRGAPVVWVGL